MEGSPTTTEIDAPASGPADHEAGTAKLAVPVVVGTRPEAIKLVPIILALRASAEFHPVVVSTGQHHRMVSEIFGLAGIGTDVELWVGDGRAPLNERVSAVMRRFDDFCREWFGVDGSRDATTPEVLRGRFPAGILVHGDTSSAMAAALAAFHLRIPVMHVEAGLRAGGLNLSPFPEELNRRLISKIACFHFAPTSTNQENLIRENIPEHLVFVTGNTGIDALRWASELDAPIQDPAVAGAVAADRRIVVVTAHRRENWNGGLAGIAAAIAALADSHPETDFVVPLHPNPLVRQRLGRRLEKLGNVLLTEPMGYATFARLLRRCHMVITDSGGIQEEAPSLGKPVLVVRDSTERTEGVEAGTLDLVGTDPDRIVEQGARLLDDPGAYDRMAEARNPYGDGKAADRIVAALNHLRTGDDPPRQFGCGYERRAILEAAGYPGGLDPVSIPADERDAKHDERGPAEDGAESELWPT
ncbi:MAG: non-hydrolyzing UDP-N-acetylglucosamine 2-epimerase [Solirubrobacterales bacterium]